MITPENASGDYTSPEHADDGARSSRTTDIGSRRKAAAGRPKVALAVTLTCPDCDFANKPAWLSKSHHGDAYATTMFCEQCGGLMAIWAMHVEAQVVAHKQASRD
jgi:hypothetical protein